MATAGQQFTKTRPKVGIADMGDVNAAVASYRQGMRGGIGRRGINAMQQWYADISAGPDDMISEQEFEVGGYQMAGKWHEGMSKQRAQIMLEQTMIDEFDQRRMRGGSAKSNFLWSLVGGMTDPAEIAVAWFAPEVKFMKVGRTAVAAAAPRIITRGVNQGLTGMGEGVLSAGGNYHVSQYTQQAFGGGEVMTEIAASAFLGLFAGGARGVARRLNQNPLDRLMDEAHRADHAIDPASDGRQVTSDVSDASQLRDKVMSDETTARAEAEQVHTAKKDQADAEAELGAEATPTPKEANPDLQSNKKMPDIEYARAVKESHSPKSADETLLADIFKKLFNIDIRYMSESTSRNLGVFGMVSKDNHSTVFVRAGRLEGGPTSMLEIVSHETAHVIRMRDPVLWQKIVKAIVDTGKKDNPDITVSRAIQLFKGDGRLEGGMNDFRTVDEFMATVFSRAIQHKGFWANLKGSDPKAAGKLSGHLARLAKRLERMGDKHSSQLARDLNKIVNENDTEASSEWTYESGYDISHVQFIQDMARAEGVIFGTQNQKGTFESIDRVLGRYVTNVLNPERGQNVRSVYVPYGTKDARGWALNKIRKSYERAIARRDRILASVVKLDGADVKVKQLNDFIKQVESRKGRELIYISEPDENGARAVHTYFDDTGSDWHVQDKNAPDKVNQNKVLLADTLEADSSKVGPKEAAKRHHARIARKLASELKDTLKTMEFLGVDPKVLKAMRSKDTNHGVNNYISNLAHQRAGEEIGPTYRGLLELPSADKIALDHFEGRWSASIYTGGRTSVVNPYADIKSINPKDMLIHQGEETNAYMTRMAAVIEKGKAERVRQVAEGSATAASRLTREAEQVSAWTTDYSATSHAEIQRFSDEFGLDLDVHLRGRKNTPEGATPVNEAAVTELSPELAKLKVELEKLIDRAQGEYDWIQSQSRTDSPDYGSGPVEEDLTYFVTKEGITPEEAVPAMLEASVERGYRDVRTHYLNYAKEKKLNTWIEKGPDHYQTRMDGVLRGGVETPGASVQALIETRMNIDGSPVRLKLEELGLLDAWRSNSDFLVKVAREIEGHNTGTPEAKIIADMIKTTHQVQTGRLNRSGAHIRLLDGFLFSQIHSRHLIMKDKAAWKGYLQDNLDWERSYSHLKTDNQRSAFLDELFREVTEIETGDPELNKMNAASEALRAEDAAGNETNKYGRSRNFHFKPGKSIGYDMDFGSGNTSGRILNQIGKRAEESVILDSYGTDYTNAPLKQLNDLADNNSNLKKGLEWKLVRNTYRYQIGELDHPANVHVAAIGQTTRAVANIVAGWGSTLASFNDAAGAVSALRWAGVNKKGLHAAFAKNMRSQVSTDPKTRDLLVGMGAGFTAMVSSFNRIGGSPDAFGKRIRSGSSWVFKMNGQEDWGRIIQSAYADIMSQHFAEMATKGATPEFKHWLSIYGISDDEFAQMGKYTGQFDKLENSRLAPNMIDDIELSDKLMVALHDTMNYAMIQPSISVEAGLRMGTKAGTVWGEAIRTVGQYKSFPLTLMQKVRQRFKHGYNAEAWNAEGMINPARMEFMSYAAGMTTLAILGLSIKDIMRNREPFNPFDSAQWTTDNMGRILSQAGFGAAVFYEQFSNPAAVIGPAGNLAMSIARSAFSDDPWQSYRSGVGSLPGASIPFVNQGLLFLGASVYGGAIESGYDNYVDRIERSTGKGRLIGTN